MSGREGGSGSGSPTGSGKRGTSADDAIPLDLDSDDGALLNPRAPKRVRSSKEPASSRSSPSVPELSSDSDDDDPPRRTSTTSLSTPSSTGALQFMMRQVDIVDLCGADDEDIEILDYAPRVRGKARRSRRGSGSEDDRRVDGDDADDEGEGRSAKEGGKGKGTRRASTEEDEKKPLPLYPRYTKYHRQNWPIPGHDPDKDPDNDDLDWLKIFQRFVILAVLRWHEATEPHQKAVITRPYLQVPYERQLTGVRDVARGLWNGSRCSAGRFRPELVKRPIDRFSALGYGTTCTICHGNRPDRLGLVQYHIEGRPYDDDTFVAEEKEWKEFDWQLGTTCWLPITGGHQTWHQMYTTFHNFERSHIDIIEVDTPLMKRLEEADIDSLVQHFLVEIIPEQIIEGKINKPPISVYDNVMNDIRGRTEAERTRRVAAAERAEEATLRKLERDRLIFRRS